MAHAVADSEPQLPRPGLMAIVRNRRGVIASVDEHSAGEQGTLHLVTVEYTDTHGPPEEQLLWEREPQARVVSPNALPDPLNDPPMKPREFDALTDATRWSAVTPFLAPDDVTDRAPTTVAAPFYGAVQTEDFQIVPLLKAMRMPRVSLMLADDVGLGKTIEAGMILRELLLRRRARRVLILTPASLREQWEEEMREKFSLSFDIVDRHSTQDLKKRMGLDANPWRTHSRIISSYHYLRQPNIREEFRAATSPADDDRHTKAKLPWDLLIVDEAHNLMPNAYGEDSQLAETLREISPWFEHKLFLTATPHDGYTRSFTGLLESLDPVRFQQKGELTDRDEDRIDQIVVRRLKRDINELDEERDRPRRFAKRKLHPVPVDFSPPECRLSEAFDAFRTAVKEGARTYGRSNTAANFAVQILNKRLLSSPYTFADSWLRFTDGLDQEEAADDDRVQAAKRAAERDIDDDRERESIDRQAARTTGAWLKAIADEVSDEIDGINRALSKLGIERDQVDVSADGETVEDMPAPNRDSRYDALRELVERELRDADDWRDDERLVVFTEYKTTLDYLVERLRDDFDDPEGRRVLFLFGGMSQDERSDVKRAFNNPDHPVRILVGTDAASEGLNLQETARRLLHFDVPWNPSVLDQRNGRLDRHGQARDVHIYHFDSEDDADTSFMSRVVGKVEEIREDLGSMGEVFDAAFEARFLEQQDAGVVFDNLETETAHRRGQTEVAHTGENKDLIEKTEVVEEYHDHLGLSPDRLANALEVALALRAGYPQLEYLGEEGRYRFANAEPPTHWRDVVNEGLRIDPDDRSSGRSPVQGSLPKLAFDPEELVETTGGRPVFRTPNDTVLMHLGHPVYRHALARFARLRFPGSSDANASRWQVRPGDVPDGADAVVELTVEEMAVNDLREPFHHWVRPLRFPVHGQQLGEQLPYEQPDPEPLGGGAPPDELVNHARDLWPALEPQLEQRIDAHRTRVTDAIERILDETRDDAIDDARQRFDDREAEVKQLLQHNNVPALERELEKVRRQRCQTQLMVEHERQLEKRQQELEQEIQRAKRRYDDLLERLEGEKKRMLEEVLPKRHSLSGEVQAFPVTVEIVLPREEKK